MAEDFWSSADLKPATAAPATAAAPTAAPAPQGRMARAPQPSEQISGVIPDPKSLSEALFSGAMLIAPAAKLIPYVARLPLPLVRIALGAITAGWEGATAALIGETVGAGGPKVVGALETGARKIPGVRAGVEKALGPSVAQAVKTEAAAGQAAFKADTAKYREDVAATKEQYRTDVATRRDKVTEQKEQYKQAWQQYRQAVDTIGQQAQAAESTQMSQQVGQFTTQRVPTLGNRQTAEQLDALKQKGTKALVGEYFTNKMKEAEGMIGGPSTTLRIPSLRRVPEASKIEAGDTAAMDMLKEELIGPGGVKIHVSELRPTGAGAEDYIKMQEAAQSAKEGRMTLSTVVDKLAALRLAARVSNDPAVRTVAGKASRVKMTKALGEVEEELSSHDPAAWDAFHEGRKAYAFGSAMLDLMRRDGVFRRDAAGVQLNIRNLQTLTAKHRGWLEERMGADDFKEFTKIIQRGGGLGPVDVAGKAGQPPQFVGRPPVSVPVAPERPTLPAKVSKPTLPARPTPPVAPSTTLPTTLTYPVDLTRAMIDSAVHRALPK